MAKSASFPIWKPTNKLVVGLAAFFCLSLASLAQNPAVNADAPHIVVDKEVVDFGKVEEGIEINHDFKVTNSGGAKLTLTGAFASCGCTTPKLTKNSLLPGESTVLNVVVDTSMKQKNITKTVKLKSNDPVRPVIVIELKMDVLDAHRNMTAADSAKIFTDEKCMACHVYQGTGLFGRELYNSDCAMCHGPKAEGAVGPALFGPYENVEFKKKITTVASYGSKTHRSMPGFLGEAGGPLSKEQIDSIVNYLAALSKKRAGK